MLNHLGANKTEYQDKYNPKLLECFDNPRPGRKFEVSIEAPEVTCLCPITRQPDFATIKITYCPDEKCVESKSFKLYLFSYRQTGIFHEAMTNQIADDLFALLNPHWIEVQGEFAPRGGIKFWPKVFLQKDTK